MTRSLLAAVLGCFALSGSAQSISQIQPNLSGQWVLASATFSGAVRGDNGAPGSAITATPATKIETLGVMAFNCGRTCKIAHTDGALLIENATFDGQPTAAPVKVGLTGQALALPDPSSPGRSVNVTAKWTGPNLRIDTNDDPLTYTQAVSIDKGQLVVVSETFLFKERRNSYTYRYDRK